MLFQTSRMLIVLGAVGNLFFIAPNVIGLGEVAFVRWLVCRKAILPNPCYMKCRLIYDKAQLEH